MRVAILLSGQMRRFADPDVLQSVLAFFRLFDTADVFISTWSDRGVSYNHGDVRLRGDEGDRITEANLRSVYPSLRACAIHELGEWERGLTGLKKQIYEEGFEWQGMKIRGTVVPQLFGLWDANRLRTEYERLSGVRYDLVIRCRPDVLFDMGGKGVRRSLFETMAPNTIYAINNPGSGTYYPQRVYDIFFYGDRGAMDAVCGGAWENLELLVGHPWQNGLHPRDACRCLYVQARFLSGCAVQDVAQDLCLVKR